VGLNWQADARGRARAERDGGVVTVIDAERAFAEGLARLLTDAGVPARPGAGEAQDLERLTLTSRLVVDVRIGRRALDALLLRAATRRPPTAAWLVSRPGRAPDRSLTRHPAVTGWLDRGDSLATLLNLLAGCQGRPVARPNSGPSARQRDLHSTAPALVALTSREHDVLQAIVTGERDRELAERLGISRHTVRTHIENVLGKLGVHSRHEAAAVAVRSGVRRATAVSSHAHRLGASGASSTTTGPRQRERR